jgi:hypothetical protein
MAECNNEYKDEENYLRNLDDAIGIIDCYDKYGVVGILNVLSPDECDKTVQEIELLEKIL